MWRKLIVAEMLRKEKNILEMENTLLLECGTLMEVKKKSTLKELFKTMLHKLMAGETRLKNIEV